MQEPDGWISRGIVNVVETSLQLPEWDGDQAGRFYYDQSTDELWMGTSTEPFKFLITGPGFAGFAEGQDLKTIILEGSQALDFENGVGKTFKLIGESLTSDSSFVYLNGTLQKPGDNDDFIYIDSSTIKFNFDLTSTDRISIIIVTTAYMTNYTTKAYMGSTSILSGATKVGVNPIGNLNSVTVQGALEELQQDIDMITGGSNLTYSMQDAYEDGSIVTLNANDVDFRVPENKSFKISDGSGSVATATYQIINLGGNKSVADNTGLSSATKYYFKEENAEINITTGLNTTFGSIIMLLNDVSNYKYEMRDGNLVCVSKTLGSESEIKLDDGETSPKLFNSITGFVEIQDHVLGIDASSSNPLLIIDDEITAYTDILPSDQNINLGSSTHKFNSIWASEAHFDADTIYLGSQSALKVDNVSFKFTTDGGTTYAEIPKVNIPNNPTVIQASSNQTLTLEASGTGKILIDSSLIELKGNIIPTTTNLYNLGSSTHKLANVYAEEVHVGASSLYVNGKKVIEDVSNTMTFATDIDQSMNIKTKGAGNLVFISQNEINAQANGGLEWTVPATTPSKNIEFTNLSANGQILLYSTDEIDLTASLIDIHGPINATNLTLSGNLTVNGTTTTVNTEQLLIKDNIITLNSNQTGTPQSFLISGIEVHRGEEGNYRFIFEELSETFRVGMIGQLQAVATREDAPISEGIATWDPLNNRFNTVSTVSVSQGGTGVTTVEARHALLGTATANQAPTWRQIVSADISDATQNNTSNTIVKRDADRGFKANSIQLNNDDIPGFKIEYNPESKTLDFNFIGA